MLVVLSYYFWALKQIHSWYHWGGFVVPLQVELSAAYKEKWLLFVLEDSTVEAGAVKHTTYKFIMPFSRQSALLKETTVAVNKRMAVGFQLACHFAEAWHSMTNPVLCSVELIHADAEIMRVHVPIGSHIDNHIKAKATPREIRHIRWHCAAVSTLHWLVQHIHNS